MGRPYGTCGGKRGAIKDLGAENSGKGTLGISVLRLRIILKWILREWGGGMD
jgi:hypothetical protein